MPASNNKSLASSLPSDRCLLFVAALSIFILTCSSVISVSVYFKTMDDTSFFTSKEFVIFITGATVALLQTTLAMWALIIKMRYCDPNSTLKEEKSIEDDEKTQSSSVEEEIVFQEDDFCEIV